jgi:polysaccharide biosynthesis transport protein
LEGQIAANESLLNGCLQQQSALNQSLAQQASSIVRLDQALVPIGPSSPRPVLNTCLAAILGLFVGAGVILLRDYMDDSLKDPEDISRTAGVPILGVIRITDEREADADPVEILARPRFGDFRGIPGVAHESSIRGRR